MITSFCVKLSSRYLFKPSVSYFSKTATSTCNLPRPKDDPEILSSLYISGSYGDQIYKVVNPYFDIDYYLERFDDVLHNLKAREIDCEPFINLNENLAKFVVVKKSLSSRQEITDLTEHIKTLLNDNSVNNRDAIAGCSLKLDSLKKAFLKQREKLSQIEELVIPLLIKIPNRLHPRMEKERKILFQHTNTVSTNKNNNLDECIKKQLISSSTNCPNTYYLQGKAAILEQSILEYFEKELKATDFRLLSSPHFVKSLIVEACMKSPFNNKETITMSGKNAKKGNNLHLLGGTALESFAAYFTRTLLHNLDLPLSLLSVGRNYNILNTNKFGLYTPMQSSDIGFFSAHIDENSTITGFDKTVDIIQNSFLKLQLPVQTVQVSIPELNPEESLRVQFEIWSPCYNRYMRCAHISLYGDFISKRLSTYYSERNKKKSPKTITSDMRFVSTFGGCAVSAQPLLAGIIENSQLKNDDFLIPKVLEEIYQ